MYYYLVRIGVQRHWKTQEFTYEHAEKIEKQTIVRIPFGKKMKIGFVSDVVKKPAFKTKQITEIYETSISRQSLTFMSWYATYYAVADAEVVSQMFPQYLHKLSKFAPTHQDSKVPLPELSSAQKQVVHDILKDSKPVVFHGITASGKTRVYSELIQKQLSLGKHVLVLYPEIAVTPQIAYELKKIAPVVVFHSGQTDAERSRAWTQVMQSSEPLVVIGPRSCLFLPFPHLGLIIIDEAHDAAYKQDTQPRYHGIYVAGGLAKAYSAQLVLGSATPPIVETEHILASGGRLVCLHEKAIRSTTKTEFQVVAMRDLGQFTKHRLISDELLHAMAEALGKNKQSLLFLNRRGTSKVVLCSLAHCDWIATCEQCDLSLTYHHDTHILLCHTCGRKYKMPSTCPTCESEIVLRSFGSKAIVEEVKKLFPTARVARYDSDTKKDESLHNQYDEVKNGSVDILVGTQQLVKGLDLPLLSVVGILNADLSLRLPDFSSEERTFQLISQASGRVGRGHTQAKVVIQSFQPHAPVITQAINEDWHTFRDGELVTRKLHALPPYRHMLTCLFRDTSEKQAFQRANEFRSKITSSNLQITIEGPVASFHRRVGKHYYIQLHLKSTSRNALLRVVHFGPENMLVDFDPISLL
jgi:primosomal protein N' (replication factor Y)